MNVCIFAQYSCQLKIMMSSMNKTSLKNSKYRGWSYHYQERLTLSLFIALLRSVFPHIHRILYKTIKNKNEGWRKAALRLNQITRWRISDQSKSKGKVHEEKKEKYKAQRVLTSVYNLNYLFHYYHEVVPLSLIPNRWRHLNCFNLATRWRHLHWFEIWPTCGATCISSKFDHQVAPLP